MAKSTPLTGTLPVDGNFQKLQNYPSFFQTEDATATPVTSPKTVSSTVIILEVPTNALSLVVYSTANAVRVSDESTAASHYFVCAASTLVSFPVAKMDKVYLLRDGSSDATVQFYFVTL